MICNFDHHHVKTIAQNIESDSSCMHESQSEKHDNWMILVMVVRSISCNQTLGAVQNPKTTNLKLNYQYGETTQLKLTVGVGIQTFLSFVL
jgi:hypothetical protein